MVAGISEVDFWRQTPRQTQLALEGIAQRERRARKVLAWHALHLPAVLLHAQASGEFLPLRSLEASVNGEPEPEATDEELLEAARRIGAAFAHLPESEA